MARVYLGLSGFSYKEWQGEGLFYPPKMKATEFFAHYRSRFPAVEMDGSWYRMPPKNAVASYVASTEPGYRFSFKAHRQITHMARLKPEALESLKFMLFRLAPLAAADRLGPLLVQLPPNMKRDDDRLRAFLEGAPKVYPDPATTHHLEPIASSVAVDYAFEFRHESWDCGEVEAILSEFGAAWVMADTDDKDATRRTPGRVLYARLRKTDYPDELLQEWAAWLREQERDAYIYCKHEDAERPWEWADRLRELT